MKKFNFNKLKNLTDTNLLLLITIVVFFVMYLAAMIFLGEGFLKPQTLFNILNANAANGSESDVLASVSSPSTVSPLMFGISNGDGM